MKNSIATTVELRQKNRRELLSLLVQRGKTTRNSLKELSGFSYSTIGNLLGDLQQEDFILQQGEASSTGGRKAQVIKVNPQKGCFLAVDISGKSYKWGLYDLEGSSMHCSTYEYVPEISARDNFQRLISEMDQLCHARELSSKIRQVGVVISGYYQVEDDSILDSYDDEHLASLKIKEQVTSCFNVPVVVKNDAKVAAYHEISRIENAHNKQLFYLLVLRESFGSALVLNGSVYGGNRGYAGEVYPLQQVYDGKESTLGELLHPLGDLAVLSQKKGHSVTEEQFFQLFRQKDEDALKLFEKTAAALAKGILQVLCVLNPSDVRIGGFYNYYGPELIDRVRRYLMEWGEGWQYEELELAFSDFSQYTLIDGLGAELRWLWIDSLWMES